MYADQARFNLRYAPIFDEAEAESTQHFKLMVVEITCQLPPDPSIGRARALDFELLRCGWQLELKTAEPCRVDAVPELDEEVPLLLGRMAACVNRLADEARVDAPMPVDTINHLVDEYRRKHTQA